VINSLFSTPGTGDVPEEFTFVYDLETASLQFYRQGDGRSRFSSCCHPAAGSRPRQSELESRVDLAAEPWVTLAREAAEIIAQRHRLQAATVALRNVMRQGNTSRSQLWADS
jgi:hypothetical protein